MNQTSVHRWFKKCLERAGVPDLPMHELRHTAADEIWRVTGDIVKAQQTAPARESRGQRLGHGGGKVTPEQVLRFAPRSQAVPIPNAR
jgi:integrase